MQSSDGDDGLDQDRQQAVQREELVLRFVENYLRHDGVFLLRLIAHNTNGITTTEITRELWDLWFERQPPLHRKSVEANELSLLHDDRTVN